MNRPETAPSKPMDIGMAWFGNWIDSHICSPSTAVEARKLYTICLIRNWNGSGSEV
ncbi:hypothetical protein D3C75_1331070 [compost metagenome]